jgi:hypothetical protein
MEILFIPFCSRENNKQLISMAAEWQAAYQRQAWATQCENQVYSPGVRVLEGVSVSDTLYVLAHGQGTQLIINEPKGTGFVLDARMLALRIFESGLPSRHRRIVLNICNTNGTFDQFAHAFKQEMWQLNYTGNLEVCFYSGSIGVPYTVNEQTGEVGQSVMFLSPGSFVATPRGLVHGVRMLRAGDFMHLA